MIRSMTGFARAEAQTEGARLSWELRSLNHRYLDVSVRLPEELRGLEGGVRERLAARLARGKVECQLRLEQARQAGRLDVDTELAGQVLDLYKKLSAITGEHSALRTVDLIRWPGVVCEREPDLAPLEAAAMSLLEQALDQLVENREREGRRLAELILARCERIEALVAALEPRLPEIRTAMRERLHKRLAELEAPHDSGRLEQELVYLFSKLDVDEELDRLRLHVQEIRDILQRDEPVGRRLDFLMQELNREANTLGSKASALDISRAAVDLKVLIEQMREQIQNIE